MCKIQKRIKTNIDIVTDINGTVWMISTARFSVHILLLHHYGSDLAHISDRYSSVIEMYLSEMLEKIVENKGLVVYIQNLHTFE